MSPPDANPALPTPPQPRPPTSGFAIAAMIASLLFCVPFITSALGIVLALIAIPVTASGQRGGRQTAFWALILGIAGVSLWSATFYQIQTRYIEPKNRFARFTQALTAGDHAQARALATADVNVDRLTDTLAPLGHFIGFQPPATPGTQPSSPPPTSAPRNDFPFQPGPANKKGSWVYDGPMYFDNRTLHASIEVRQEKEGWLVSRFELGPLPTSRPAATGPTTSHLP